MINKIDKYHLSEVTLRGYKSIQNVQIELADGLNIIIGKNAAGKTNFLTFLKQALDVNFEKSLSFYAETIFRGPKEISINAKKEINKEEFIDTNTFESGDVIIEVSINGKTIDNEPNERDLKNLVEKEDLLYIPIYIKHGVPENYELFDKSLDFEIMREGFPLDSFNKITDNSYPYFSKSLIAKYVFDNLPGVDRKKETITARQIKKNLEKSFNSINHIKEILSAYTPVKDVRLNKSFDVFLNKDSDKFSVRNLSFEFKVLGTWYPYSSLSDGTKRLVYIITEIGVNYGLHYTSGSFGLRGEALKKIVLLEEPELGVHPHQLMDLMKFINEASGKDQIIIATHSPQVLNILRDDELHRILIAESSNSKKGTNLRHLNKKERSKATKYLEEDYLSDYWVYSDLEI